MDIDAQALACAKRHHTVGNIGYHTINVTEDEFPRDRYDVVCWDGALAHFDARQIGLVLSKVAAAIGSDGVLCGSEEIETPGQISGDHKIALTDTDKLRDLFAPHFKHVRILELNRRRRMAYFRCGQDPSRLDGFV